LFLSDRGPAALGQPPNWSCPCTLHRYR